MTNVPPANLPQNLAPGLPTIGQAGPDPIYTNGVMVNASPWDFMFTFQMVTPINTNPDGTVVASARVVQRLVMSPTHAKAFLASVVSAVDQWEAIHGAIQEVKVGGV